MLRLCIARSPSDKEVAELLGVLQDHLASYEGDPKAAEALLTIGQQGEQQPSEPAKLAAWTMVANLILNLDEVVCKN